MTMSHTQTHLDTAADRASYDPTIYGTKLSAPTAGATESVSDSAQQGDAKVVRFTPTNAIQQVNMRLDVKMMTERTQIREINESIRRQGGNR
jgi:hypothetical protein